MKTNILLIITVLTINLNLALANSSSTLYVHNPVDMKINPMADMAPSKPMEATFEEDMAGNNLAGDLSVLQFTTPKEASFYDIVPEPLFDISIFAPVTPKEATFDDDVNFGTVLCNDVLKSLAPAAPKEADFNTCSSPVPCDETGD